MAKVGVLNYLSDGKEEGLGRSVCVSRERERNTERKGKKLLVLSGILAVCGQVYISKQLNLHFSPF